MKGNKKKYQKGVELLKSAKYEKALDIFNSLINEFPKNADYWSERGVTYFHMNKMKEAVDNMNKAVELEPSKSYRYSSRAYILGHFRKTEAAIADYEKAIELDPDDAIAHNNLGLLEEQLGYQAKARKRFALADELHNAMQVDGRSDQGIKGEEIKARNIQKELDQEKSEKSFWTELKAITSKEGRASFIRFISSGFKET